MNGSFSDAPTKALPLMHGVAAEPGPKVVAAPRQTVRVKKWPKVLTKKERIQAAEERPVLGTARLGFIFSIIGLGLLVTALAVMPPLIVLSLLSGLAGLITSRIALSRIKKNPNRFLGRGLARAGFIIGLLLLLIFIAFLLYLLAFAGAI